MKLSILFILCILAGAVFAAKIDYQNQVALLMSARQADIGDYYTASGVVLADVPYLDPHYGCLRVALSKKYPDFPCASAVDRLSCEPYSHQMEVQKGINLYPTDPAAATALIRGVLAKKETPA